MISNGYYYCYCDKFFLDTKQNVEEEDFVLFDKILIIIAWIN